MKIFITASFRNGDNNKEVEQLCSIINKSGFEDFCFVRDVENIINPKELMVRAKEEIIKCDILLFDASEKSTSRAIEVGIAFSNNKKIIVIMKTGTEIKDALRGVADAVITYDKIEEIQEPLKDLFSKWTKV